MLPLFRERHGSDLNRKLLGAPPPLQQQQQQQPVLRSTPRASPMPQVRQQPPQQQQQPLQQQQQPQQQQQQQHQTDSGLVHQSSAQSASFKLLQRAMEDKEAAEANNAGGDHDDGA